MAPDHAPLSPAWERGRVRGCSAVRTNFTNDLDYEGEDQRKIFPYV